MSALNRNQNSLKLTRSSVGMTQTWSAGSEACAPPAQTPALQRGLIVFDTSPKSRALCTGKSRTSLVECGAIQAEVETAPMLHVHNGDSTAETAKKTTLPGEHLAWLEALVCGPTPGHLPEQDFLKVRAAHLAESYGV